MKKIQCTNIKKYLRTTRNAKKKEMMYINVYKFKCINYYYKLCKQKDSPLGHLITVNRNGLKCFFFLSNGLNDYAASDEKLNNIQKQYPFNTVQHYVETICTAPENG